MPKDNTTETDSPTTMTVIAGGPLAKVQQILEKLPTVDANPTERMAAFILDVPPAEWGALWDKVPNVKENVGRSFRLHALRALDSDFEGGLPVYLISDVTWLDTGEQGLLSCSSVISMVQMLALYRDSKLPADLQIVAKDKPTKAGFRPIHLHYLNAEQAATGDPTKVVSEQ